MAPVPFLSVESLVTISATASLEKGHGHPHGTNRVAKVKDDALTWTGCDDPNPRGLNLGVKNADTVSR